MLLLFLVLTSKNAHALHREKQNFKRYLLRIISFMPKIHFLSVADVVDDWRHRYLLRKCFAFVCLVYQYN
jgi:hypothetical protein